MADMLIRNIDSATRNAIVRAAQARGLTLAEFLSKLISLHNAMRGRADAGDTALQGELVSLGLQTITI